MRHTEKQRPNNWFRQVFYLLLETVRIWSAAQSSRMSAALAYYTMLSLAPLLVMAVIFAGLFFDTQQAQQELLLQIRTVMNPEIAEMASMILQNTTRTANGVWAGLFSGAALLFGASGVFSQFFDTMNIIWGVAKDRRSGFKYTIRQRFRGFVMVLIFGLLLVVLLLLSGLVSLLTGSLSEVVPEIVVWLRRLEASASLLGLPLLFMLLYRFVPLRPITWRDVWLGSILAAGLFILARMGIAFYLSQSSISSAYGAASSLVALLIWVYFSGMIIFLGGAFCKAYAHTFGSLRNVPQTTADQRQKSANNEKF